MRTFVTGSTGLIGTRLVRARRRQGRWTATVAGDEGAVREAFHALGAEVLAAESLSLEDLFVDYTTTSEVTS